MLTHSSVGISAQTATRVYSRAMNDLDRGNAGRKRAAAVLGAMLLSWTGCGDGQTNPPFGAALFAVIGDYGMDTPGEAKVAELVKSWKPDHVITTGDNNYPSGERSTIDKNIGKYYAEFIGGYTGQYGPGSDTNRFWPVIGNHDYYGPEGLQPYLDYFPMLPGNKRYYEVRLGKVHLFALNSDYNEPSGVTADSGQAMWLKEKLEGSDACFKIVALHHPPYSSGEFGVPYMDWPYAEWGADVVLGGHEHLYERLLVDGIPHVLNGLGGANLFEFKTILPESLVRFTGDFGAMLGVVEETGLRLELRTVGGLVADSFSIDKACP